MSPRLDRYQLAVMLAQEILQGNPAHDQLRIDQAAQDIADEVTAGRLNQRDMAEVNYRTARLLNEHGYSVQVPERPALRLVGEDGAA